MNGVDGVGVMGGVGGVGGEGCWRVGGAENMHGQHRTSTPCTGYGPRGARTSLAQRDVPAACSMSSARSQGWGRSRGRRLPQTYSTKPHDPVVAVAIVYGSLLSLSLYLCRYRVGQLDRVGRDQPSGKENRPQL